MQPRQGAQPRPTSAFAAAFLSLIFPGLGHAYAKAWTRALGFAAVPMLLLAFAGGLAVRAPFAELLGFLARPDVLTGIFVFNGALFLYRTIAAIDAWRVVRHQNAYLAGGGSRLGTPRPRLDRLSVAGLAAVILVMSTAHVAVARYDLLVLDFVSCTFDGGAGSCEEPDASGSPQPSTGAASQAPSASPEPSAAGSPVGSALPDIPIPPWDGTERLNILLIGSDQRPDEGTYNTDTLIVVSVDPKTKQVAMFSLPRDAVGVPVPPGPARRVWGSTYEGKINSWFTQNRRRADLWPGNDRSRGYNALKSILGYLYGLDIKYYVEVNFGGFEKVIDTLGGVTVNVQFPVTDDRFPAGTLRRIYIPTGLQHMTGAEALIYARSRHSSSDFDRAARQQRLLVSLRAQADVNSVLGRIDELVSALKTSVRTDIPVSELPKLVGLADGVDLRDIRSYVFTPSFYASEGIEKGLYVLRIKPEAIRSSVKAAFSSSPILEEQRVTLSAEGASIWVLNGTGDAQRAQDLASWMEYRGLNASSPRQRPDASQATTRLLVYNGAQDRMPATIAFLEKSLKTTAVLRDDPDARVDIAVTVAPDTPRLAPPRQS
jgi:LCP family protein required for cell wall assembly